MSHQYKVVTWGTGNVGAYAVRAVLNHPELELIGHIVSSDSKSGKDVAELIGLDDAIGKRVDGQERSASRKNL